MSERALELVRIIQGNEYRKLEEKFNSAPDDTSLFQANYSVQFKDNNQPIIPNNNLTLLHIAAIYDSLECYILLLNEGFTIRKLSADSYTPFHYACLNASYEVAMYTLSIDPKIALYDPDGSNYQYPYLTVIGGDPGILEKLFELNADFNSRKNKLDEIFSKCISCRSIECLKILLEKSNNSNYEKFGDTTLQMKAIINNQPEALRLLVNNADDINYINKKGDSVFSIACSCGIRFKSIILDMLKLLHRSVRIEPPKETICKGVCHWICKLRDLDVAREMLETPNVDINRLDDCGGPGIFQLVDVGRNDKDTKDIIELIQLLIDKGFNLNIRAPKVNNEYKTESILEKFTNCIKPNKTIIKFLISHGADVNALKRGTNQKLIDAILQKNNAELKKIFLDRKENEGK